MARSSGTVDTRNVEPGGRSAHVPEAQYHFVIDSAELKEGKDSGKDYIQVKAAIDTGKYKGKAIFHSCSLQPQALFNLRQLMDACEMAPGRFDPVKLCRQLKGKKFSAFVEDDEYNGRTKSVIADFVLPGEDDEDEDDDEEEEDEEEDDEEEEEEAPRRGRAASRTRAAAAPARGSSRGNTKASDTSRARGSSRATASSRRTSSSTSSAKSSRGRTARRRQNDDEDDEELDDIELDDLEDDD